MVDLNKVSKLLEDENYAYEHRWEIFDLLFTSLKEGNPKAAEILGSVYNNGILCEPSLNTMVAYWNLAKNMHDPEGLYVWATDSHFGDPLYSLTLLKKSAELGYLEALYEYADRMLSVSGYQYNKLMKEAADKGHVKAMYKYAIRKKNTAISKDDLKESFEYMKLAAENGHDEAMYHLARMYDFGIGTEINYLEARKWYEKCLNHFNANFAKGYLGRHYLYGLGGLDIDIEKGIKYLESATHFINRCPSDLLYEYARCYELGIGVVQDLEKANALKLQASINTQLFK